MDLIPDFFLANNSFEQKSNIINLRGELYSLSTPKIMGILNLTPDSFFDGGRYLQEKAIVNHVEKMIQEGADFIDIGAYSSRPGADNISEHDELARLKGPVFQIRKIFPRIYISIDTFRSRIAKTMVEDFGVDMINDISAGSMDENMFSTIAGLNVPYTIMHMQGTPDNMQKNPEYENVVKDVVGFLAERLHKLNLMGVNDVIGDPGFGFGKSLDHNYNLLADLDAFSILGIPILVGLSRKSMIYNLLNCGPDEALYGTIIANTLALIKGADILRVHDVKPAKEAISIMNKIREATN